MDADWNPQPPPYYVTDDTGYRIPDADGNEFTVSSIEEADALIESYFKAYNCRYFWLKTLDGKVVCQYVRDMLAN